MQARLPVQLRCHPWRDCGDTGDAGRGGTVLRGDGSNRRELASNPHFPGVQRDLSSPKSIPHPGLVSSSPLWLCTGSRNARVKNTKQTIPGKLVGCWAAILAPRSREVLPPPSRGRKTGIFPLPDVLKLGILVCRALPSWDPLPVGSVWLLHEKAGIKIMLRTAFSTQHVKSSPCSPVQHWLKSPPAQQKKSMVFGR